MSQDLVWRRMFGMLSILFLVVSLIVGAVGTVKWVMGHLSDYGYAAYTTTGKSMEPYSYEGDLIVVRLSEMPQDGRNIVFWRGEGADSHLVFHRVVSESYAESGGFVTKGDNNEAIDPDVVAYSDVVGSEVFHASGMGWIADGTENSNGLWACSLTGLTLTFFLFLIGSGRLVFAQRGDADYSPSFG